MKDVIYAIKFYPDEIGIFKTECIQPLNCECDKLLDNEPKCGYSPEEAHKKFIEYYENRVAYLKKLDTKEFMEEMGYYFY